MLSSVHPPQISGYRFANETTLVIASHERHKQSSASLFSNKPSVTAAMFLNDNAMAYLADSMENLSWSTK